MKRILLVIIGSIFLCFQFARAQESKVLIYGPDSVSTVLDMQGRPVSLKTAEPKAVDTNVFERTVKDAIKILENSMRKTCTKEMETSISVTAEGKWAVVGVSISGAMKLLILNPEMSPKCGK